MSDAIISEVTSNLDEVGLRPTVERWDTDPAVTPVSVAPQCPSVENPSGVRRGESPCRCDHAEGHGGSHICAQHALRWTQ